MLEVINVSSKSSTKTLAQLILEKLQSQKEVTLKAIGAGAVNQAVKGVAVAAMEEKIGLKTSFFFFNVMMDGQEKSGIKFVVKEDK